VPNDEKASKVATQVATEKPAKTLTTSVFSTQTMKTTCPGRDSNQPAKTLTAGTASTKKPQKKPQSEPHAAFCQRLQAAGFDAEQLQAIDAAMLAAGVTLVATERYAP